MTFVGGRPVTREDVIHAYRFLFGREPESEAVIDQKLGLPTVEKLRQEMLRSAEFRYVIKKFVPLYPDHKWVRTDIVEDLALWIDLRDSYVSFGCLTGNYEYAETRFVLDHLSAGDHFIDIGANVGWFTLLAARKVGATGKVTSFEPRTTIFKMLQRSVLENGLSNVVTLHNCALGDTKRTMWLTWATDTLNGGEAHLSDRPSQNAACSEATSVQTLDDMALWPKVAVVKIDAEGAEPIIVRGAQRFLQRDRPIVVCEVNQMQLGAFGASIHELLDAFHRLDYSCHNLRTDGTMGERVTSSAQLARDPANVLFVAD
jgi:FkbM family methyltransferase